jgi:hypothetical protein
MSREVRMVTKNWVHPKRDGVYIPLLDGNFHEALSGWQEEKDMWDKGFVRDYAKAAWKKLDARNPLTFEEWYGDKPNAADYMPEWKIEEATFLMMYETTSEGTPISPAFETAEELARWLADNNASACADLTATYEEWLATIKVGGACDMVQTTQGEFITGVAYNSRQRK